MTRTFAAKPSRLLGACIMQDAAPGCGLGGWRHRGFHMHLGKVRGAAHPCTAVWMQRDWD
jgi:hypothetical protein